MRKQILFLAVALSFGLSGMGLAATGKTTLDGKTFKGELTEKGEKEPKTDDLTFDSGKFTSAECVQYGFNASPYKATTKGETTTWTATAVNENGAKMHWTGKIMGDTVEATATWSQKGEKSKKMSYKGKLATAATATK